MKENLKQSRNGSAVTVTVTGFHVEVSRGATAAFGGGGYGLHFGGGGALSVEVAFPGDIARGSGYDAAEIGMWGSGAGGFVGEVDGASDICCIERVVVSVNGWYGFADDGRESVGNWSETEHRTTTLQLRMYLAFLCYDLKARLGL